MAQPLMDMMVEKALENVANLLTDPDPYVRLQASLGVLSAADERIEEMDEQFNELDEREPLRDEEVAELAETMDADSAQAQTEEEVLERLAAAEQATGERIPPAAERAGRTAIGSGEQRR